jgi:hypothetical protein
MCADRLGDDVGNPPPRVEARVRVLEDHLHAAARATQCARIVGRSLACDRHAVVLDRAARGRIEPDDEARHRGLAASRFADESDRLAFPDREVDAVDGLERHAPAPLEHAVEPWRRLRRSSAQRRAAREASGRNSWHLRHEPARGNGRPGGDELGALATAPLERVGATRIERAAWGNGGEARHGAVDLREALALFDDGRDRPHQADRVRMLRPVDDVGHRADLHDAPRVHDRDAIGGFRDHAHVVRHEHHGRAVVAAQALQERDDLRLDRDIEGGRRLVGDDELRVGRQRERNDDAAGACRR